MVLPKWFHDQHKDPTDYEYTTAARLGGRREVASGAFSGLYDVNSKYYMADNKRTKKKSYIMKIEDLLALFKTAQQEDRVGLLMVNFHEYGESVVVMREKDFYGLIEAIEELREEQ